MRVSEGVHCGMDRCDADADLGIGRCLEVKVLLLPTLLSSHIRGTPPWGSPFSLAAIRPELHHIRAFIHSPSPPSGPFIQPLTYDEGRYIKEVAKDPKRAVFPDW